MWCKQENENSHHQQFFSRVDETRRMCFKIWKKKKKGVPVIEPTNTTSIIDTSHVFEKRMTIADFCSVLGVEEDATRSQIDQAYVMRSMMADPEKHPPHLRKLKTREYLELQQAHGVLVRHHVRKQQQQSIVRKKNQYKLSSTQNPAIASSSNSPIATTSSSSTEVSLGLVVGPNSQGAATKSGEKSTDNSRILNVNSTNRQTGASTLVVGPGLH